MRTCERCSCDFEGEICTFCVDGLPLDHDPVHTPKHYTYGQGMESMDVIEAFNMPHHLASAFEYMIRHEHKNGIEDLRKAITWITRYIQHLERRGQSHPRTVKVAGAASKHTEGQGETAPSIQ